MLADSNSSVSYVLRSNLQCKSCPVSMTLRAEGWFRLLDHPKNGAKGRKGTVGLVSSGYSDSDVLLIPALGALGSEQISFSSNTSVSAASSLAQGVERATI